MDGSHISNRCKCLIIITSMSLLKTYSNKPSFISLNRTIRPGLLNTHLDVIGMACDGNRTRSQVHVRSRAASSSDIESCHSGMIEVLWYVDGSATTLMHGKQYLSAGLVVVRPRGLGGGGGGWGCRSRSRSLMWRQHSRCDGHMLIGNGHNGWGWCRDIITGRMSKKTEKWGGLSGRVWGLNRVLVLPLPIFQPPTTRSLSYNHFFPRTNFNCVHSPQFSLLVSWEYKLHILKCSNSIHSHIFICNPFDLIHSQ